MKKLFKALGTMVFIGSLLAGCENGVEVEPVTHDDVRAKMSVVLDNQTQNSFLLELANSDASALSTENLIEVFNIATGSADNMERYLNLIVLMNTSTDYESVLEEATSLNESVLEMTDRLNAVLRNR